MAKYTILSADSASSLENKVKHSMQDGYIPIYKLCINLIRIYIRNNTDNTYLQAMYKPD